MSSVSVHGPRRDAAAHFISAKQEKLKLVGVPGSPADGRAGLNLKSALVQLGSAPLLLYLGTAAVIAGTGFWIVSDISRRHTPIERAVPIATTSQSVTRDERPAILPPARLGDGVVVPAPAVAATSPSETLNALMRDAASASSAPAEPLATPPASVEAVAPMVATPAPAAPAPEAGQAGVTVETPLSPVFDPPLQTAEASPAPATDDKPTPATPVSKCLLKVAGKVLFQSACSAERAGPRATLKLGEKTLTIALARGETWQATIDGKSLGAVYRTGECWGRKKQVYICATGG